MMEKGRIFCLFVSNDVEVAEMMKKVGFFVGVLGICIFSLSFFIYLFLFFNADHLLKRRSHLTMRHRRHTSLSLCSASNKKLHVSCMLCFMVRLEAFLECLALRRFKACLENAF